MEVAQAAQRLHLQAAALLAPETVVAAAARQNLLHPHPRLRKPPEMKRKSGKGHPRLLNLREKGRGTETSEGRKSQAQETRIKAKIDEGKGSQVQRAKRKLQVQLEERRRRVRASGVKIVVAAAVVGRRKRVGDGNPGLRADDEDITLSVYRVEMGERPSDTAL